MVMQKVLQISQAGFKSLIMFDCTTLKHAEHICLQAIAGRKFGIFVSMEGEDENYEACRYIEMLKEEFLYSCAGQGAKGSAYIYLDNDDMNEDLILNIENFIEAKEKRGEQENARLHKIQMEQQEFIFNSLMKKKIVTGIHV